MQIITEKPLSIGFWMDSRALGYRRWSKRSSLWHPYFFAKLQPDNLVSTLVEYKYCFGHNGIKNDPNVLLNKTWMISEGIV